MVERGADERDLLAHALGVGAEPAVAGVRELEELEQLVDPPAAELWGEVVDRAEVVQVGAGRHPLVEARDLRHEANQSAHPRRVVGGVDAVDPHHPGRRQEHAGHAAQGGRLAGAVAAQQHEAFPLVHLDRQVAEGEHVAVALGQALDFQHS